jgi:ATP-dependent Lhr-like helicase
VGTIADEGTLSVRFLKGRRLGSVEEAFLSRLRPGDRFLFAGRVLELVRVKDMVAYVRKATRSGRTTVPRWAGGRLPLSSHLALWVAAGLAGDPRVSGPELEALQPLLDLQGRWSQLPGPERVVVELSRSREGHHAFLFTFLGRLAHEGLGALAAWRLSRGEPRTVGVALNDYGIELLSPDPFPEDPAAWRTLLAAEGLEGDLPACLNAAEMARRRFRQIARVSGLVHPGPPGRSRSTRNLQASSGLLFDVLARYDPENLLVDQAHREVLERELEATRLREGLTSLSQRELTVTHPPRFTPLAFPIWAERLQSQVSSESWLQRVQRMAESLEAAAGGSPPAAAGTVPGQGDTVGA